MERINANERCRCLGHVVAGYKRGKWEIRNCPGSPSASPAARRSGGCEACASGRRRVHAASRRVSLPASPNQELARSMARDMRPVGESALTAERRTR
jgi:hypothetical protein